MNTKKATHIFDLPCKKCGKTYTQDEVSWDDNRPCCPVHGRVGIEDLPDDYTCAGCGSRCWCVGTVRIRDEEDCYIGPGGIRAYWHEGKPYCNSCNDERLKGEREAELGYELCEKCEEGRVEWEVETTYPTYTVRVCDECKEAGSRWGVLDKVYSVEEEEK